MNLSPGKSPRRGAAVLAGWLLAATACAGTENRESALSSLVESERAFAQSAAQLGARDAFIAHLADDAVIFRPRAVAAQEFLRNEPATPGLLLWEPAVADISEAGDLGFTTGPWAFRPDPNRQLAAYGQYFSFWKKQDDGSWKVVIDHGTVTPPAGPPLGVTEPDRPEYQRGWAVEDGDLAAARAKLLDVDREFAAASVAGGMPAALTGYLSPGVLTLRNGSAPFTGIEGMQAYVSDRPGTLLWQPQGGDVSLSGDLGYTYGEYEYTAPGSQVPEVGTYMRAWRRISAESWRIVVDLLTPLPGQGG